MNPSLAAATAERLARYDRPGPRYTSYPTAVEFHDGFTPQRYVETLAEAARRPEEALSLYVHLPFCAERCSFCGCNVIITRRRGVAAEYLRDLATELDLVGRHLGDRRRVVQLHWGGGTPTYLTVAEMQALWDALGRHFDIQSGSEIAIEVDPRVTTAEQVAWLHARGFNRVSMGVQDFDARVQDAINRNQTFEQTRDLHVSLREHGIESINFDFVYGLPQQTPASFRETIARAVDLRPDRVAVYSYAFVPWVKAHQKAIRPEDLPPREVKLELFGIAFELFSAAGYVQIGMDHFALPSDSLARAAASRTLHRNFMGYTTRPAEDSIGFGVSAIGELGGAFAQNTKKLTTYREALASGLPPIARGYERSRDDVIRRDVIESLMCNFHLDVRAIEAAHHIDFSDYFEPSLAALDRGPVAHGFVRRSAEAIEVTPEGRLFVRNVCMAFDAYLQRHDDEQPRFSRTV
jgi:oxygen-independent coproporphyrinogen III oxidase